jgi:hypothetical protein
MRRGVVAVYFLALGALSCAFGGEEQATGKVLVVDVYSAKVAPDATQEKAL